MFIFIYLFIYLCIYLCIYLFLYIYIYYIVYILYYIYNIIYIYMYMHMSNIKSLMTPICTLFRLVSIPMAGQDSGQGTPKEVNWWLGACHSSRCLWHSEPESPMAVSEGFGGRDRWNLLGFHGGTPIRGLFIMENPHLKWMIWGYPHFRKPPHVKSYWKCWSDRCIPSVGLGGFPREILCHFYFPWGWLKSP